MREIDDKTLKELVNYSKEYFKNIDSSFFGGLADLLSNIGEKLQNIQVNTSVKEDTTHMPPNLDLKILDIAVDFYKSLSPDLGDMASNSARKSHIYMTDKNLSDEDIHFLQENGQSVKTLDMADHQHIPLEKSWNAVIIAVHEIAHRFTSNDITSIMPENRKIIDEFGEYYPIQSDEQRKWDAHEMSKINSYILSETIAIYAELLCTDYIKENYDIDCNGILPLRYSSLSTYAQKPETTEINILKSLKEYVDLLKTEELDDGNISKYKNALNNLIETTNDTNIKMGIGKPKETPVNIYEGKAALNLGYHYIAESHRTGYIFANYLHQSSLGNKEKQLEIFNNMLSALSKITEFGDLTEEDDIGYSTIDSRIGDDEIDALQKTGLPIAKDGKLQMSDDAVKSILEAFDKSFFRDKSILKEKKIDDKKTKGKITIETSSKAAIKLGITEKDVEEVSYKSLENSQPDIVVEEEHENE